MSHDDDHRHCCIAMQKRCVREKRLLCMCVEGRVEGGGEIGILEKDHAHNVGIANQCVGICVCISIGCFKQTMVLRNPL